MGQRGASATWQSIQALAGHGSGLAGRQQQLSSVPVEGNQGHLVPALVALRQQADGCALHEQLGCQGCAQGALWLAWQFGVGAGCLGLGSGTAAVGMQRMAKVQQCWLRMRADDALQGRAGGQGQ